MNILVVGSCNMDLCYELSHLPAAGESVLATNFSLRLGGKGQNQAVCAARLGAEVTFIGAVGKDKYGETILSSFQQEGVDISAIKLCNAPTGTASIYVDPTGQNQIVIHPGANAALTPNDIKSHQNLFSQADFCILQLELPLETVYAALDLCLAEKVVTILNPAPAPQNFKAEYYSKINYLIPNETELNLLSAKEGTLKKPMEQAKYLMTLGAEKVIVTLGEKGALFLSPTECYTIGAKKVCAVDTTGAGDAFVGAFVYGLSQKKTEREALELATTISAFTVTKKGAMNSLPTKEELKHLL